jgi:hypothetical protein
VCLQDGDDPRSLGLGELDVGVNEIDMGVHHRQFAVALTPKEIGGAGRFVVEELSEEDEYLPVGRSASRLDKLSSVLLNSKGWLPIRQSRHCSRQSP